MDYIGIKNRISTQLNEIGISAQKMAEDLNFTPQGYRKWFLTETLRVKTVMDIAEYLKVDPSYLLFGNNEINVSDSVVNEPTGTYKTKQYLEQRVEALETQMKKLLNK